MTELPYPSALPKEAGWTATAYGSTKAALELGEGFLLGDPDSTAGG